MHRLGVKKNWQFHDCFGLDEELLGKTNKLIFLKLFRL